MELTPEDFSRLINPQSIAIVGVSERTGPESHNLMENLLIDGGTCRIYPVNKRAEQILGRQAYRSVLDLPETVDLAIISTPRNAVPEVVRECVQKGIESVVVITQGFADADDEGQQLQSKLDEIVAGSRTRILGPNTIGVVNAFDRFHTSFQRFDFVPKPNAWICQSGSFILASADFSGGVGLGIDLGNASDIQFVDVLPHVANDPRVQVVNMHMEGIGEGQRFLEIAGAVTPHKPIVVYKTGRSEEGSKAVVSHSGALAGEDHVFAAAFRKAGLLQVDSLDELHDLNKALLTYPEMNGNRVGVITISGGCGIAALDALGEQGLELARLGEETKRQMQGLFPDWFKVENLVDYWPAAMRGGAKDVCQTLLELMLADEQVDSALFVVANYEVVGYESLRPLIDAISEVASARRDKPVAIWVFGANNAQAIAEVDKSEVLAGFSSPERAARALAGLHRYTSTIRGRESAPAPALAGTDRALVAEILRSARAAGKKVLGPEALEMLQAYGVPVATTRFAASEEDALVVAESVGYPLVMKIASSDISHKSDAGGIRLNIASAEELSEAYRDMMETVGRNVPEAVLDGVLLQRYYTGGTEVIVGSKRDAEFGPVVVFGLGGIYTEVLKDAVFRIAPLAPEEAREMVGAIRAAQILEGVRGEQGADMEALSDALLRVAQLTADFPEIQEFDVNPLATGPWGVLALDARAAI